VHDCSEPGKYGKRETQKGNLRHLIAMPERRNDVFCTHHWQRFGVADITAPYDDGQGRPKIQNPPQRSCVCTENSQIEAARRRKHERSPSLAHMNQRMPCVYPSLYMRFRRTTGPLHIETEYFQGGMVGEYFDGHGHLSVESVCSSQLGNQYKATCG